MTKWSEISLDFFIQEVFSRFWDHKGDTENKVLELQVPISLATSEDSRDYRIFLGSKISARDYPNGINSLTIKMLDMQEKMKKEGLLDSSPISSEYRLSLCNYANSNDISILPFGYLPYHREMLLKNLFGIRGKLPVIDGFNLNTGAPTALNLWYQKEEDNYVCYWYKKDRPLVDMDPNKVKNPMVRVRQMDYTEWQDLVNNNKLDVLKKDDIKKEYITLKECN